MAYDSYHLRSLNTRDDSPPRVVVRAANNAAYLIGTYQPASSKTRVLNWKDPILQACAAGDSKSLKIMYAEARVCVDEKTEMPTADEMFLAAISEGRIPILKDIHDLVPNYHWSEEVFAEAMSSDMESGGNHYLLGATRWSKDPLRLYGSHGDTLMWAVRLGDIETAVVLLSWGASPNGCKYQNKFSHLQVAASMHGTAKARYPPMVQLLIQYGANIHGTGILSWTAGTLGFLPSPQRIVNARDVVSHLLHAGADVNEFPPDMDEDRISYHVGQVPLVAATVTGSAFMVNFLLFHHADPSIKDTVFEKTPYEIACEEESESYPTVFNTFVSCGISPATLWGILDSDLKKSQPSPCNCSKINTSHDVRWVPAQRTDF